MNSGPGSENSNRTVTQPQGEFARLIFRERGKEPVCKDILQSTTLIGSSRRCHIRLKSQEISYAHCLISFDAGLLRVRDLRTRTGTKVNGTSIEAATLTDGDTLELGPFVFVVETNLKGDAPETAAAFDTRIAMDTAPQLLETKADFAKEELRSKGDHNALSAWVEEKKKQLKVREEELNELTRQLKESSEAVRKPDEQPATTSRDGGDSKTPLQPASSVSQQQAEQQQTDQASPNKQSEARKRPTAEEIARRLVTRGLINRSQADQLLGGKFREFPIDHYNVVQVLGAGGMGWLYRAVDTKSGEKVALKIFSEHRRDDPSMLARFELESQAGAKLEHPNIIRTHRVRHTSGDNDVDYFVMEFVEGINLEELIGLQGAIPWRQACDLMRQAAMGLQHAHESGMIHRDVKPANLLVEHDGHVKLLDFGLALLDGGDDEFSLAMIFGHNCLGTADYIAPEQAIDSFSVDATADVYSLGCTFYFALTGVVPFPTKSILAKLESHKKRQPRPVRERTPDVPEEVAQIVEKMMSKQPQQRYRSAAEVVEALALFARRQPTEFDFEAVLEARAIHAKRRMAALLKD